MVGECVALGLGLGLRYLAFAQGVDLLEAHRDEHFVCCRRIVPLDLREADNWQAEKALNREEFLIDGEGIDRPPRFLGQVVMNHLGDLADAEDDQTAHCGRSNGKQPEARWTERNPGHTTREPAARKWSRRGLAGASTRSSLAGRLGFAMQSWSRMSASSWFPTDPR